MTATKNHRNYEGIHNSSDNELIERTLEKVFLSYMLAEIWSAFNKKMSNWLI